MERIDKLWKSSMTWTTVMLVLLVLGVISGGLGLPKTFNYAAEIEKAKGTAYEAQIIAVAPTLIDKVIAVFSILIQIVVTVLTFINRGKIRDRLFPDMTGYYLNLGMFVFGIIYTFVKLGRFLNNPFLLFGVALGLVFSVLGIIPTILVISRQNALHKLGAVEGFDNENQ